MNVTRRILAYGLLAALIAACADLSVENLNEPDKGRALATPGDVETLIAGSFLTFFRVDQDYYSAGMSQSVMADEATSSWGNAYMREGSIEPRIAIPNDQSHGYAYVFENPWFWSYSAISAVRDGLVSIAGEDGQLGTDDDMEIGDDGADTPRAIAFAKFIQGLAHGYLALIYDKAFIVDETTDVDSLKAVVPVEPIDETAHPYPEVAAAGIGYLQEAIDIASQNSFTIPQAWVGDGSGLADNTDLAQLAHSYAARIMAGWPRWESERQALDPALGLTWANVLSHAEDGITEDFIVMGDGYVKWYSDFKWCLEMVDWARTDLRMLGAAASTATGAGSIEEWINWENTTPMNRQAFQIDTDDARMPMYPPVPETDWEFDCQGSTERSNMCGLYIAYRRPDIIFRPERGTYHFSGYGDYRHVEYVDDEIGPILMFNVAETNLLAAEALIWLGREAEAVPLINITREANGQLPPVDANGAPEVAGRCTPREFDGSCADLWESFKYEKRMEVYVTGLGVAFRDDRGWGDLLVNTPVQWPIPAEELATILQEVYTFGGGGEGSAPDVVAWSVADGGGLRPLRIGEVPSAADIAARVRLFERINAAGRGSLRRH